MKLKVNAQDIKELLSDWNIHIYTDNEGNHILVMWNYEGFKEVLKFTKELLKEWKIEKKDFYDEVEQWIKPELTSFILFEN